MLSRAVHGRESCDAACKKRMAGPVDARRTAAVRGCLVQFKVRVALWRGAAFLAGGASADRLWTVTSTSFFCAAPGVLRPLPMMPSIKVRICATRCAWSAARFLVSPRSSSRLYKRASVVALRIALDR